MVRSIGAAALLALLAACSGGAREVDYPPERGISADVAAAQPQGATSLYPGMNAGLGLREPLGAIPWQLGERHQ